MELESCDNLIYQGLEYACDKVIYEAKYGKKKFVDGLSKRRVYKDHTERTIKDLDEILRTKKIERRVIKNGYRQN